VDWVKTTYGANNPAVVDTNADAWASQYLRALIEEGKSPYTLQTVRSALRLCFWPDLASSVELPKRKRSAITRSRVPVKQDAHFQPKNWPELILFAAQEVSESLGHSRRRRATILNHYLI
jgi:hypothetical protein